MKKFTVYLFLLAVLVAGFSSSALADSTASYSITGIYGTGTQTTDLTAAGQSFSMSFSVPTNPASLVASSVGGDDFYLFPLNITYTFEGTTSTLVNTLVAFYATGSFSQMGGLFVDYCADVVACQTLEYQWTFQGPQQYIAPESNPTMTPTSFVSNGQPLTIYDNSTGGATNSLFDSTVNGTPVNAPEPSSLLLLGAGLAGVALLVKFRS